MRKDKNLIILTKKDIILNMFTIFSAWNCTGKRYTFYSFRNLI
jgi:predicted ATPase